MQPNECLCRWHGHFISSVRTPNGWYARIEDSFGDVIGSVTAATRDEVIEAARRAIDEKRLAPVTITGADVQAAMAELDALSARRAARKCVGCGERASHTCPQCGKPTCRRAVGLCGHAEGICAECVEQRFRDLNKTAEPKE